ncbi:MAG: hypothetical protein M3505_08240 [Verrucomicrobiota bacterium]|nr:hypothetical protein [Verrucomicrobiota bacterium]
MAVFTRGAEPAAANIYAALAYLESQKMIERQGEKRYKLRVRVWDDLTEQVIHRRAGIDRVLDRHFPGDIAPEVLRAWFNGAAVAFFSIYGDKWVASVARDSEIRAHHRVPLERVLREGTRKVDLEARLPELVDGFQRFIRSTEPEDTEQMWHLGRSMFAARLASADLAADPISAREIEGSTILFDTNLLLDLALEESRNAPSLAALGRAFEELAMEVCYVHPTLQEYRSVVQGWKATTEQVIDRYGPEIVRRSSDDHVRTAVSRGCETADQFGAFYTTLEFPPALIGDRIAVTLLDDSEVAAAVDQGRRDESLVTQIQVQFAENRPYVKRREAAEHDAAVTAVGRMKREKGERCWVLSRDLTMHDIAFRKWAGPAGTPLWISLDALIQILAIEQSGSGMDAIDFAPVLALLIAHDVEMQQVFTVSDLEWLDDLNLNVGSLLPDQVQEIAQGLHRRRLAGAKRTDEELLLWVQRTNQESKRETGRELSEAKTIAADQMRSAEAERTRANAAEGRAAREAERAQREREVRDTAAEIAVRDRAEKIIRGALRRARVRGLLWAVAGFAMLTIALTTFYSAAGGESAADRVQLFLAVVLPALGVIAGIWRKVIPDYRREKKEASSLARQQVADELARATGVRNV